MLFSHPADFTPVCTTELGRMAVHKEHFCKRNVKLLAHSVDDLQSHVDWVNVGFSKLVCFFCFLQMQLTPFGILFIKLRVALYVILKDIKSYCLDIVGDFPYPIISDAKRELAVALDMIDEQQKDDPEIAKTVRALYVIDPNHRLRLSMIYPMSTGRNVE